MAAPTLRFETDASIQWSQRVIGTKTISIAHQRSTGRYFHFGAEEAGVFALIDGRTPSEVLAELDVLGFDWTSDDLMQFVLTLQNNRLVTMASAPLSKEDPTTPPSAKPVASDSGFAQATKLLSSVLSQRLPLFDGHRISQRLAGWLGWTQSGYGLTAWSVLMGVTAIAAFRNSNELYGELSRIFDSHLYLAMLAFWALCKIVHESGHATAAAYHGVRVRQFGIAFFLFAPLAYVDVTDAWKLSRRWPRIQIALGGVYFEVAIAAFAFWFWLAFAGTLPGHLAAQLAFVAGPATILINANPLLRLDGYFVLSDLTGISNLRMHGRDQLLAMVNRMFMGEPLPTHHLSGWRRSFATLHAAASSIFQVFWMSGLVFAVALWMRGLGIALAVIAILLWVVLPVAKWSYSFWNTVDRNGSFFPARRRLVSLYATILLFLPLLFTSHSPLARRVPVVVTFQNEQLIRALGDATVRAIHVDAGQRVHTGMLLVEMEDLDLKLRRDDVAGQAEIAGKQSVAARQRGDHAMAESHHQRREKLRAQVAELDSQIAGLTVYASRDGQVIGIDLDRLQDSFVKSGTILFQIGDSSEKELLVAVPPSDVESYQRATLSSELALVRLRGGKMIQVVPTPLAPRARLDVPHPALSAAAGGPLAIESIGDPPETKLIEPYMQSRTPLDPIASQQVHAGQIGTMTIPDTRTVYERLEDYLIR
jgi:putative peptide zinc metalloprotease protein